MQDTRDKKDDNNYEILNIYLHINTYVECLNVLYIKILWKYRYLKNE